MKYGVIVSACLLLLAMTGVGIVAKAAEIVRVGELGIGGDAPFYIAVEKGYFKDAGIDARLERFASASSALAPLATGEIQVAGGGVSPGLFNGFARRWPIKIVAHRGRDLFGSDVLMVRADLKDEVRRYADLRGRKVAVNAPGSALVYMLGKMLERDGLSLKDVDLVFMPWPDMGPAFANKAIDAGAVVDPFIVQFEDKGLAVAWKDATDVIRDPAWEIAVLLYNAEWAAKHPRVAGDFMVAYLRGARDFVDAMTRRKNRNEIIQILVKYTRVKDPDLYERLRWSYIDPNGQVVKESLRDQQDWYARQGSVPKKADIDEMIDQRFMQYAIERIGAYK